MHYHTIFAMMILVTAIATFINERYLNLPRAIAVMIVSLVLSIIITQLIKLSPQIISPIHKILSGVDFKATVLDVLLGYILFAGSLQANSISLKRNYLAISYLAIVGVIISVIITGYLFWSINLLFKFHFTLIECFMFGAVISPTDPISVLSILQKTKNVPEHTKTKITGEALFNDAAGVLILLLLVRLSNLTAGGVNMTLIGISYHLITEVLGAVVWGYFIGVSTSFFLSRTNDQEVGIFLTTAASTCGYIVANSLHISGIITMIIAGLVIGSYSKQHKFSKETVFTVNSFWTLIDGLINAVLFVIIGLELLTFNIDINIIIKSFIAIFIVLIARFCSMVVPTLLSVASDKKRYSFNWSEIFLLTWGGVRGAISIALAMSIPNISNQIVAMIYLIVIFSIIVQGSTFQYIANKIYKNGSN